MRDLTTYFSNPFSDPKIALDRKKAFGEDTIQRIIVPNTNHQFVDLLAKTTAVQDNLFGGITDLATDRAVRKARTQSTDTIIADFKARNSRLNAYLIANNTDKENVYQEFFPQGVQAFTRDVNKENVEQRMKTLITAITNNTDAAGGATVLLQYQAFADDYKQARTEQLNKTGEISSGEEGLDATEAAWDDRMFSNLLTFAQLNRNQPGNLKMYMDQLLLEHDAHHDTTLTGKIKGMITDAAGHPLKNVVIHILDGKTDNAHTDTNGVYLTHPLPIGTWEVDYSKGDRKLTKQVEIKQGEVLQMDVVL